MNYEEIYKKNTELQNASQEASNATKEFNQIQIKVNETRIKTVEKLAYFSAGTIALSITFVGYLISNNSLEYLRENFLKVPLVTFLFLSWALLLLSVIGSVFVRFWNASYLLYNKSYYWASSNKKLKEKMFQYLELGAPVAFLDADTPEQAKSNIQNSKDNYQGLEGEFENKKKFYLSLVNWLKKVSITSFLLGLISLLVFAVVIVIRIIFFI